MRPLLLALLGLGLCFGASAQGPAWDYAHGPFASGSVLAAHPGGAVFSVRDGYLLISWDHGRTWQQRSDEPIVPRALRLLGGDDLLALGSTGIIRSHDLGRTWGSAGLDGVALRHLDVDPNGPWYAAEGRQLYRSEDDGQTWVPFTDGLGDQEVHALIAPSANVVFAGTEDGVFLSTGGGPWTADGLAGRTVHAFAVAADGLLAGTDAGLFRRSGGQWRPYGSGLEGRAVLSLLVTTFDGEELIVAGTEAGVYLSRPGLITIDREEPATPPGVHRLLPPYPNPARTSVTLAFELAHEAPVRLTVYDVLGRAVARLADAPFGAGQHELPWWPEGLAGGGRTS